MPYYTRDEDEVDDFDEFDPTPYSGGYDITVIYGRPISPCDETCYPIAFGNNDDVEYERPEFSASTIRLLTETRLFRLSTIATHVPSPVPHFVSIQAVVVMSKANVLIPVADPIMVGDQRPSMDPVDEPRLSMVVDLSPITVVDKRRVSMGGDLNRVTDPVMRRNQATVTKGGVSTNVSLAMVDLRNKRKVTGCRAMADLRSRRKVTGSRVMADMRITKDTPKAPETITIRARIATETRSAATHITTDRDATRETMRERSKNRAKSKRKERSDENGGRSSSKKATKKSRFSDEVSAAVNSIHHTVSIGASSIVRETATTMAPV